MSVAFVLSGSPSEVLAYSSRFYTIEYPRAEIPSGYRAKTYLFCSEVMGEPVLIYSQQLFDQAVWAIVKRIPVGQVMSYGEVARVAGFPRHVRMVSKSMSRCEQALPWHRVVRSDLSLAFKPGTQAYQTQKDRLEAEGVAFLKGRAVPVQQTEDLDRLIWGPDAD